MGRPVVWKRRTGETLQSETLQTSDQHVFYLIKTFTLLNMLNISPFSYGLLIQQVYDNGSVYSPEVLDITEESLHTKFLEGVRNIASVCLEIGYPTLASVPHSVINGYKRVL